MSEDVTPLNAVLSGEEIPEPTVETVDEPVNELNKTEEPVEPTVEESAPAATTAEEPKDEVSAFKQAMLDERQKRQDLEEKLKAYESQPQEERPDAFAEPDKAIDYGINSLESKFENRFLNMSEYNASKAHDDFSEMKELFFYKMVAENPYLQQQALQHPDPYGFVYEKAKAYSEFSDVQNLEEWKSQKEAEIRAKVEAELKAGQKAEFEEKLNKSIPPTISDATAAGGTVETFTGVTPLNKIIG